MEQGVKYNKMEVVATGEVVTVKALTMVDVNGLWTTVETVQDKWGETPLWQYRQELRPAV